MHATTNLFFSADTVFDGNVKVNEHEYSNGPYAVVELQLGSFSVTCFPKQGQNADLADMLERVARDLRAADAECKAQALTD